MSELDEMLSMAFVGLYVRDAEGDFVSLNEKYNVLEDSFKQGIKGLFLKLIKESGNKAELKRKIEKL